MKFQLIFTALVAATYAAPVVNVVRADAEDLVVREHKHHQAANGDAAAAAPAPAASQAAPAKGTKKQKGGNNNGAAAAPASPAPAAPAGENDPQAAQKWHDDTNTVSSFLNKAPTLKGQAYKDAAAVALAAEKDELNHKAVLDKDSSLTQKVAGANNALVTQGSFQKVVDALQQMVNEGDSTAVQLTNSINANRCKNVLPAIDTYLAAAGTNLKAVRPIACQ